MAEKNFGIRYFVNFIIGFFLYICLARLLFYNRLNDGAVLNDPLLARFNPHNFSVSLFILTYTGVLAFIVYISGLPRLFIPASRAFLLLFVLRVCFILLIPLKPPSDIIFLNDPFVDRVIGFKAQVWNDLFFSGHVADLFFFAFCTSHKILKFFFLAAAILVSAMLVGQKVHYTADVLAAPVFAYACYSLFVKKHVTD